MHSGYLDLFRPALRQLEGIWRLEFRICAMFPVVNDSIAVVGGSGGIRTHDQRLMSPLLYH